MKEPIINKINEFNMDYLGYDMMGYTFDKRKDLSFHHLLIPRKVCKQVHLGSGCFYLNSAILVKDTSHAYLHIIESINPDMFYDITSELLDENIARRIQIKNLKRIREILLAFEREHSGDTVKHNAPLIKEDYIWKRIKM